MGRLLRICAVLVIGHLFVRAGAFAQLYSLETEDMRLVYYGKAHDYLVRHSARSFQNALAFHRKLYGYEPGGKITVVLHDLYDFGNAGAGTTPSNHIVVAIAPYSYVFETKPANERMNATMNHEMVHIVTSDGAGGRDRFFRTLFRGKVAETDANPLSLLYGYMTSPRRSSPRWYREGIAVFLETWMAGGLGRALGGYDEMVFRTLVLEDIPLYDEVGLESEGVAIDFQVSANSYLYGTRFMSYLALTYGPERLVTWTGRDAKSTAYFSRQFEKTFGLTLRRAWQDWIAFEQDWQRENLESIRRNSITPFRPLTPRALGSVSRVHLDPAGNKLYLAADYPGQVAHLAALDLKTGSLERLIDVKGASLYDVSSLALNAAAGELFYTTDNNEWRDLRVLDLGTRKSRTLLKDARIGDLAFNPADSSLWGVRHSNGFSSMVRLRPPYDDWELVYAWPYGSDLYDLDVSPDGRSVVGALAHISGDQSLVMMNADSLLAGRFSYRTLFEFGTSSPSNFTFSADGRYLYGTSYYTGVSNVFRYDLVEPRMEVMSNALTGLFRPFPISDDSLFVVQYTREGFVPGLVPIQRSERVGAIRFLGQEIVERRPIVKSWLAGSPGSVPLDSLTTFTGSFDERSHLRLVSAYPVVEGYKEQMAYGLRLELSTPIGLHRINATATYSPSPALAPGERLHLAADYLYRNWQFHAGYNGSDFYDLFGPRRSTRKGYAIRANYRRTLMNDRPRRLDYNGGVSAYGGFEKLPDYQNIDATYDWTQSVYSSLVFSDYHSSLGAVDHEKGLGLSIRSSASLVNGRVYPRVHVTADRGFLLPVSHLSVWFRGAAGVSLGERDNPFANFYFGGFGNNWVDRGEVKRFRQYHSFPGLALNAVGGTSFGKLATEAILPPLRFRKPGISGLYVKWIRPTLFAGSLVTNPDEARLRHFVHNAGGQLDVRLVAFSHLSLTVSAGYGTALSRDGTFDEWMFSLKIL